MDDAESRRLDAESDIIVVQDFLQDSLKTLESMIAPAEAAQLPQLARRFKESSHECTSLLQALNRRTS